MAVSNADLHRFYEDPTHLPGSVAFFIERPTGEITEAIPVPGIVPDTEADTIDLIARYALNAVDPEHIDDVVLTPMPKAVVQQRLALDILKASRSNQAGQSYSSEFTDQYEHMRLLAEIGLMRGMDQQGPAVLATVHSINDAPSARVNIELPQPDVAGQATIA